MEEMIYSMLNLIITKAINIINDGQSEFKGMSY